MPQALSITETRTGDAIVLLLAGHLDTNTSPQLEATSSRLYTAGATPDVVVDLGACDFVSSAGLRVIVSMQRHATRGGSLRFVNVSPEVMEVFRTAGFDRILSIG